MTSFAFIGDFDKTYTGYTNKYLERRNDIKTPILKPSDKMYADFNPVSEDYSYSIFKDLERTPISTIYFSKKNVDYLQNMIMKLIYKETGHKIGRQSDEELLIIMRSYYLSNCKNLPDNYGRQVAELNYYVLKYAIYEQILPKVKGYSTFLEDNMRTNVVLPRERHVSVKGSKVNRGSADLI